MNMTQILRQGSSLFLLLSVLTGIAYPLLITAIAQLLWSEKANGSLIYRHGTVAGSELIGQQFSRDDYFWGRPSATSPAYNAGASSGSNLGPLNPTLAKNATDRLNALRRSGLSGNAPIDLVTSSGSGLDPHISIASARYQVSRIADRRQLSTKQVDALVDGATEGRQFGVLGEARVNVLRLNLALDEFCSSAVMREQAH